MGLTEEWSQLILAVLLPVLLVTIWGVFAVPDDPSRPGIAPVHTPGIIRLAIELSIFGFANGALNKMGFTSLSIGFGLITLTHYLLSYDRIEWLILR